MDLPQLFNQDPYFGHFICNYCPFSTLPNQRETPSWFLLPTAAPCCTSEPPGKPKEYGLGLEDPLEEGMATHSSIPTWKIPWTEKPGVL